LLRALAAQSQGNLSEALKGPCSRLAIAEPEGYVRVFADEGGPMAALLRRTHEDGIAREYTAGILAACREHERVTLAFPAAP
jgi:LuxR family maltose regulon positive regulatory protein